MKIKPKGGEINMESSIFHVFGMIATEMSEVAQDAAVAIIEAFKALKDAVKKG
ncbi:MAG TPA: hypothetical protein PKX51_18165 [Cyclobacteriaceae bacterium]|nr:hypothetical protein [Cyclobacteriaceae bacterium]HND44252.1 hypothetical protein [Cyclobacteriaceae bacterium]